MSRNFANWLDAYVEYADNKFAPRSFHLWSGISLLSAALERKVWLPLNHAKNMYPNIYVFLVSLPGAGKSSALDKAVDFIRDYNKLGEDPINIIPDQVTEQVLIDLMSAQKRFQISQTRFLFHSSAFFPASEASNTFKSIQGSNDLLALLTQFYDSPSDWKKATKKDGTTSITNLCLNVLAGCTFDFLGKLVTSDSIFGGFASRVIYVVHNEKTIRKVRWKDGEGEDLKAFHEMRARLLADYRHIAKLHGAMHADRSFIDAYEAWYPKHEEERQSHESEKMQSLLVRKGPNVLKLTALLSVAENNDLVMTSRHLEKAIMLIDDVEKNLPKMLREAKASQTTSQEGLVQAIMKAFDGKKEVSRAGLSGQLTLKGFDAKKVEATVQSLISGNKIKMESGSLKLLVDPNSHL